MTLQQEQTPAPTAAVVGAPDVRRLDHGTTGPRAVVARPRLVDEPRHPAGDPAADPLDRPGRAGVRGGVAPRRRGGALDLAARLDDPRARCRLLGRRRPLGVDRAAHGRRRRPRARRHLLRPRGRAHARQHPRRGRPAPRRRRRARDGSHRRHQRGAHPDAADPRRAARRPLGSALRAAAAHPR